MFYYHIILFITFLMLYKISTLWYIHIHTHTHTLFFIVKLKLDFVMNIIYIQDNIHNFLIYISKLSVDFRLWILKFYQVKAQIKI